MNLNKEIVEKFEKQNADLIEQAKSIKIKTEADNIRATNMLAVIKKGRNILKETFKPMYDSAKATAKTIKTEWDKFDAPLADAEDAIRRQSSAFLVAEEARRAELQRKADEKFEKASEKAAKTGKPMTAAPVIVAKVQTAEGASLSKRWYAEVTNLKALAQAVLDGRAPEHFICANQVALNREAVTLKENMMVPGVEAKFEVSTTIRGI